MNNSKQAIQKKPSDFGQKLVGNQAQPTD